MDWSVKLWSRKHPGRPLYSFEEANDYVYHAQWCVACVCVRTLTLLTSGRPLTLPCGRRPMVAATLTSGT